jgi:hypothetical protein
VNCLLLSLLAGATVGCGQSARLATCDAHGRGSGVELSLVRAAITEEALEVRYRIRNNSGHDIWVCDDINVTGRWHIETYFLPAEQTLVIRRRLGVPTNTFWPAGGPDARYVRLRRGQVREEGLRFTLPVHPRTVYAHTQEAGEALAYAKRLLVDIGYYDEDLPRLIRRILDEAESGTSSWVFIPTLGRELNIETLYQLNRYNKDLNDPDEPVIIPYWTLERELSIRLAAEDLRIPYEEAAPGDEREMTVDISYDRRSK